MKRFIEYIPWALFQQYAVVLIYLIAARWMEDSVAFILALLLFVLAHAPNKFLMALGLIVEGVMLYFYGSIFSLAWMSLIHAAVASLAAALLPFSITKGMKVLWNYSEIEGG